MALVINTNIASLNAQRNLSKAQAPLQTAMQRLSSTLRINSAKDDAAGLAVATRMLSQARGLSQAVRNANDGISVAQTAEGAMDEVLSALQRIRELSVQSAHGIYTTSERGAMNQEAQQLVSEINRIADQTRFSTVKLLDGTFGTKGLHVGAESNEVINISLSNVSASTILGGYTTSGTAVTSDALLNGSVKFTVAGTVYSVAASAEGLVNQGQTDDSAWSKALAINNIKTMTGITATAVDTARTGNVVANAVSTTVSGTSTTHTPATADYSFSVTGRLGTRTVSVNLLLNEIAADVAIKVRAAINAETNNTGVSAGGAAAVVTLTEAGGGNIVIGGLSGDGATYTGLTNATTTGAAAIDVSFTINTKTVAYSLSQTQGSALDRLTALKTAINAAAAGVTAEIVGSTISLTGAGGVNIAVAAVETSVLEKTVTGLTNLTTSSSIGLRSSTNYTIGGDDPGFAGFTAGDAVKGTGAIDLRTQEDANLAIDSADAAMSTVTANRSDIGAILNRLESTVRNLENVVENITAARSRIMDADFAAETANLTKAMIMQQAGISVLSQANTLPQQVLALLGGR